jgi:hypothetical protein
VMGTPAALRSLMAARKARWSMSSTKQREACRAHFDKWQSVADAWVRQCKGANSDAAWQLQASRSSGQVITLYATHLAKHISCVRGLGHIGFQI